MKSVSNLLFATVAFSALGIVWVALDMSAPSYLKNHELRTTSTGFSRVTLRTNFNPLPKSWDRWYGTIHNGYHDVITIKQVWQFKGETTEHVHTLGVGRNCEVVFGHQSAFHVYDAKGVEVGFIRAIDMMH